VLFSAGADIFLGGARTFPVGARHSAAVRVEI
jgi:hypothetical protein